MNILLRDNQELLGGLFTLSARGLATGLKHSVVLGRTSPPCGADYCDCVLPFSLGTFRVQADGRLRGKKLKRARVFGILPGTNPRAKRLREFSVNPALQSYT